MGQIVTFFAYSPPLTPTCFGLSALTAFGSLQTEARVKISHSFGLISQNYLYPRRDGGSPSTDA